MQSKNKIFVTLTIIICSSLIVGQSNAGVITPILPVPDNQFEPVAPLVQKDDTFSPTPTPFITIHADPPKRPVVVVPQAKPKVVTITKPAPKPVIKINTSGFRLDPEVSWYGPGFYGKRTACGLAFTKTILGVANKTLPCGTKVTFSYKGRTVTVPVIDRGPYVAGRQWDLSGGLCTYLHHCFTGPLYYRIER